MNTKITLIEQVLQADYYQGNIEGASLKNNSFTIWTTGSAYVDLIENPNLFREVKRKLYTDLIKDDGSVILTFKLEEQESTYVAGLLKHKKDADGYNLYRIDWKDDRDFRTQAEKDFDSVCSSVESAMFGVKYFKKENLNNITNPQMNEAALLLDQAAYLIKKANSILS